MRGEISLVSGGADTFFAPIHDALRAAGCATVMRRDMAEVTSECDALVVMGDVPVGRGTLARLPRLRVLASAIIGVDAFDIEAATDRGVAVVNAASEANAGSIAEAAILMALAALFRLPLRLDESRSGARPAGLARMLGGRTVGLIGFGAIARQVAKRIEGWDCPILAYARQPITDLPPQVCQVDLGTLIAASDVVMPLTTLNDQSRHLLNERRLRLLRHGAVVVNVARGALIDEEALIKVLADRTDLRVALDTFEIEPLPVDSPLRAMPEVVLTDHCIGHTHEAAAAMQQTTIDNVLTVLRGQLPQGLCNAAVTDRWLAAFGSDTCALS